MRDLKQNVAIDKYIVPSYKIAIVKTRYHAELVDNMDEACKKTLIGHGVKENNIGVFTAPGAWELPVLVQEVLELQHYDAIIVLGVVIKGETYHFEMIANEVARALMILALEYSVPVANEVLAVYTKEAAEERAKAGEDNKGAEAAVAVLELLSEIENNIG